MNNIQPPKCEICNSGDWSLIYENLSDRLHHVNGTFSFWRCDSCLVGRTWPTPANIEDYYPQDYYAYGVKAEAKRLLDPLKTFVLTASWRMRFYPEPLRTIGRRLTSGRRCVDEVSKYAPSPSFSLLDVGCGSGFFLRTLKRIGVAGSGIELSKAGAAETQRSGFVCHHGPIETAAFPKSSFDVVRFSHVLEHTESPLATLIAAHRLLKSGGRVVIHVPNVDSIPSVIFGRDWWPLEIPRHLWHFTAGSLIKLIDLAGFEFRAHGSAAFGPLLINSVDYRLQTAGLDEDRRQSIIGGVGGGIYEELAKAYADIGGGDLLTVIGSKP